MLKPHKGPGQLTCYHLSCKTRPECFANPFDNALINANLACWRQTKIIDASSSFHNTSAVSSSYMKSQFANTRQLDSKLLCESLFNCYSDVYTNCCADWRCRAVCTGWRCHTESRGHKSDSWALHRRCLGERQFQAGVHVAARSGEQPQPLHEITCTLSSFTFASKCC